MKMTRLPKAFFTACLILMMTSMISVVQAQVPVPFQTVVAAPKVRPKPASPGYVAMLFSKMIGKRPKFEEWAMASRSYNDASKFDKVLAQKEKIIEFQGVYDLLTPSEPLIIEVPMTLSEYSRTNQGFFIDSFTEDTFFAFDFLGTNYAVIPINLMDYQWIKASADQAKTIMGAIYTGKPDTATALIYIDPKFADKTSPLNIDGKDRWMISGQVRKIEIYTPSPSNYLLWESDGKEAQEDISQEILNLKRP